MAALTMRATTDSFGRFGKLVTGQVFGPVTEADAVELKANGIAVLHALPPAPVPTTQPAKRTPGHLRK